MQVTQTFSPSGENYLVCTSARLPKNYLLFDILWKSPALAITVADSAICSVESNLLASELPARLSTSICSIINWNFWQGDSWCSALCFSYGTSDCSFFSSRQPGGCFFPFESPTADWIFRQTITSLDHAFLLLLWRKADHHTFIGSDTSVGKRQLVTMLNLGSAWRRIQN